MSFANLSVATLDIMALIDSSTPRRNGGKVDGRLNNLCVNILLMPECGLDSAALKRNLGSMPPGGGLYSTMAVAFGFGFGFGFDFFDDGMPPFLFLQRQCFFTV